MLTRVDKTTVNILGSNVLKYFVLGMGVTNHIILNMVVSIFHHIPSGGEVKNIKV